MRLEHIASFINNKIGGVMSEQRLDDQGIFNKYDPKGLVGLIELFGAHAAEAITLIDSLAGIESLQGASSIVCLGMGGSAIGSELAGALIEFEGTVPITVVRDYRLPAFVNDKTLVIAASYSGNTEETLADISGSDRRELGDADGKSGVSDILVLFGACSSMTGRAGAVAGGGRLVGSFFSDRSVAGRGDR